MQRLLPMAGMWWCLLGLAAPVLAQYNCGIWGTNYISGSQSGYCPCLDCLCQNYPPSQFTHTYTGEQYYCQSGIDCPVPCTDSTQQGWKEWTCDPDKCGTCGCRQNYGPVVHCDVCYVPQ